jgi:hypothetical protein
MQRVDGTQSRLVSLLISTAVRYAEFGSIRFDPRTGTMRLAFLLKGELSPEEHLDATRVIMDLVEVYTGLRGVESRVVDVEIDALGPLSVVTVIRDVQSLTPGEIYTLVEFFRDRFGGQIATEPFPYMGEEEWMAQDEWIEEVVTGLSPTSGKHLIAIREDGRLMVFQK